MLIMQHRVQRHRYIVPVVAVNSLILLGLLAYVLLK